jgi:hypothetical protein
VKLRLFPEETNQDFFFRMINIIQVSLKQSALKDSRDCEEYCNWAVLGPAYRGAS